MDPALPINPQELIELAAIAGGVLVTSVLGYLAVRRARAARRRQIEESGEPGPARDQSAEAAGLPAEDLAPRDEGLSPAGPPEHIAAPPPGAAEPRPERRAEAAEERRGEPAAERTAQVIPFPTAPAGPQPAPAVPVEKPVAPTPPPRRKRDVSALAPGLARTRSGWVARLGDIFAGRREIDASIVDEIERVLLTADIGVRTSQKLLEDIRGSLSRKELKEPETIWAFLRQRAVELLSPSAGQVDFDVARPMVLLVIGVNGSGKTTTIGKLAAKLTERGKRVLLAAGDTFRAAATEQLEIWAKRVDATIVRGKEGSDPSSVIFEAVKRGKQEGFDVVVADTAGRLHTKTDLMQELQKIRRVTAKAEAGAPHETWLVIDATSGQNAIAQAQIFTESMAVSGIVLTKLDGTAKGGVILGIVDQLKIPVRYIGIGERVDDLREFDPEEFVEALFAPATE